MKGRNKRNERQQCIDAVKPLLDIMAGNWKQAVVEQVRSNRAAAAIRAVAGVRRYGSEVRVGKVLGLERNGQGLAGVAESGKDRLWCLQEKMKETTCPLMLIINTINYAIITLCNLPHVIGVTGKYVG